MEEAHDQKLLPNTGVTSLGVLIGTAEQMRTLGRTDGAVVMRQHLSSRGPPVTSHIAHAKRSRHRCVGIAWHSPTAQLYVRTYARTARTRAHANLTSAENEPQGCAMTHPTQAVEVQLQTHRSLPSGVSSNPLFSMSIPG